MFIDGIQYAAVSRNLALGVGSFWNPELAQNSVAGLNTFHEHPPLVFFMQSLFFKVFGLHNIYPERIYCLFAFLMTATFIGLIWRKFFEGKPLKQLWWLPVLLWLVMPVVFWAYTNNIQENTMGVFTTAAVYFFLCALGSGSPLRSIKFYMGCVGVLLAVLSKGVPGLFPLTFFFIYWISLRKINFGQAFAYSLGTCLLIVAAVFIILQNPTAKDALHTWFFDRMLKRISTEPVEKNHLHILIGLFTEQLPAIFITAAASFIFRLKRIQNRFSPGYVSLFLLLGLAASLPLTLTLVQRNFYFVPALPMFAIGWSLLIADGVNRVTDYLNESPKLKTLLTALAFFALLTGVTTTILLAGKIKRDKDMLHDVYAIQKVIPENSFVSVPSNIMWLNWSLRCYMMRYNSISFSDKDTCNYFLSYPGDKLPDNFEKIDSPVLYTLQINRRVKSAKQ
jgi:4-amino-4-deoxy-L-arabinose transferase-like glycosyltransferase